MSHAVLLSDIDNCDEIEAWAVENCPSFAYRTITDVSDVSHTIDTVYEFHFGTEKDAMWFSLKFK